KYKDTKNNTKVANIQLPLDSLQTKPNDTCSSAKESFSLSSGDSLNFTLTFSKNENSVFLESINLFVKYDNKTFPDINSEYLKSMLHDSYFCNSLELTTLLFLQT